MREKSKKKSPDSMQACIECKRDFSVYSEDLNFYSKMNIDIPRQCPDCRAQLRHIFRNERNFYKRNCSLCRKKIITTWSPNKDIQVYCVPCWWSDQWDPYSYGIDYDPRKAFFEQVGELYKKVPKPALVGANNVNCQYVNYVADCKGCYMIMESSNNENCTHSYWIQKSKDCVDSSYTHQVELSYDVDDCHNSYKLKYCRSCYDSSNSSFLQNCKGCSDCTGCINLRNKSYCIFNKQYTKEKYLEKLKEFKLDTHRGVEIFRKKFEDFIKPYPRKYAEIYMSTNSTGNYAVNTKNNRACFHSYDAEDNAYSVHVWRDAKDCMDCHTSGRTVERIYNSTNTGLQASNCICCHNCWSSNFIEYSFNCPNSNNLFGCMALKKGEYSILNKKYSKEEYKKLREQIIEKMKQDGIYGEFFPKELTIYGYNESTAMEDFPLTKEEALAKGFKWEDSTRGVYGQETISWNEFPESTKNLPENFDTTKAIFKCLDCEKNYILIKNELSFYRNLDIPIPRSCPDCRHAKRIKERNPNKLWERSCMCENSDHEHPSFGGNKCMNYFETSYAPDRPEIIYCEECYNREVY